MSLTVKQNNFCNYYIETGNASEAYRRAYNVEKMKDATINRKAHELISNGKITARLSVLRRGLQERSDITKDEAVKELTNIVRARVTDVVVAKGKNISIKDIQALPDHIQACISSVKSLRGGGIEVRFYDKIQAIDRLSKMLGWDETLKVESTIVNQFEKMTVEELDEYIKLNGGDMSDD